MESKWGHVTESILKNAKTKKYVSTAQAHVRIACEPIPWCAQSDPKIKEKTWHISEPTLLIKKCKNMINKGPKRCPKGWPDFRGGGLGGALDGLWRPNLFLNTKSMPKVLQKWLQGCKNYTKRPGGLRGAIKYLHLFRKLRTFVRLQRIVNQPHKPEISKITPTNPKHTHKT